MCGTWLCVQGQLCAESGGWWSDRGDGREKAEKGGGGQQVASCFAPLAGPLLTQGHEHPGRGSPGGAGGSLVHRRTDGRDGVSEQEVISPLLAK